ncbi:MAG TPA: M56 family metallopeptidase [Gemmatimonadaceae bacterium]
MAGSLANLVIELVRAAGVALDWVVTYALHSTVIIGAVWWLTSRRSGLRLSPAHTSWLWMVALVGGVLTASLQVSGAVPALGGTVRVGERVATRAIFQMEVVAREEVATPGLAGPGPTHVVARRTTIVPRWPLTLASIWVAGALLGLGALALARWRFFRSIAMRRHAGSTPAAHVLGWVRAQAGVTRPVRLTVTDRLTSPVAIGRDEICLPERVLAEMDHVQQESMLAHELAHLERRDGWRLMVARVIEAVCFFQPLNRLARRQMQDAAELAADAWAVRVVNRPLVLARCLARVAEWTVASPRAMVPAMVERSGSMLVHRVARLTRAGGADAAFRNPWPAVAMAALVLGSVLAAPRPVIGAAPPAAGPPQWGAQTGVKVLMRPQSEAFRGWVAVDSVRLGVDRVMFIDRRSEIPRAEALIHVLRAR